MDHDPAYDRILAAINAVEAPHAMREHVAAERDRTLVRRTVVKRMKLTGLMSAGAAVLGVVVALVAGGGQRSGPSPFAAAALAARGPVVAAPAPDAGDPRLLRVSVGGVPFPTWSDRSSWKPSGQRADRLDGRATATVYYAGARGMRLGYTIVDGAALSWPGDARRIVHDGVEVHVAHRGGQVIAFWREHGHTCVISAPERVSDAEVVDLASSTSYA